MNNVIVVMMGSGSKFDRMLQVTAIINAIIDKERVIFFILV